MPTDYCTEFILSVKPPNLVGKNNSMGSLKWAENVSGDNNINKAEMFVMFVSVCDRAIICWY